MEFTNKELRSILESHKEWKSTGGVKGQRADLRGADLRGADLSGADLRGAYLRGADLSEADLRGADLSRADLREAYLSGAYLKGADLSEADLRGADLRGAYLRWADLRGADLSGAVISDTPSPTQKKLLNVLIAHTESDHYDQNNWCGTSCCLAGAAGQAIGNQSLGIAVIMQVLPDFNTTVLYQSEREVAVAELKRVSALHA